MRWKVSDKQSRIPYKGHILAAQLEQTTNLLQDLGRSPKQSIVDLGFRMRVARKPSADFFLPRRRLEVTPYRSKRLYAFTCGMFCAFP